MGERGGYSDFSFISPEFLWLWFELEHPRPEFDKVGEEIDRCSAIPDSL